MISFIIGIFFGIIIMYVLQISNIKNIDMMNFSMMEDGGDLYYIYSERISSIAVQIKHKRKLKEIEYNNLSKYFKTINK